MFRVRIDATDVVRRHRLLADRIVKNAILAADKAKDVATNSVKTMLADRILRPNNSQGTLMASIDGALDHRGNNIVIGVGNVEELNSKAPYWYIQEHGGMVSKRVVPGFFVDAAGNPVPFDQARGTNPPNWSSTSEDVFIYTPRGDAQRGDWMPMGEWESSGGGRPSFMFIIRPITAKWFFYDGGRFALPEINRLYKEAFRGAFSG